MTRPSRRRLSPEERGRGFAKLAAEISQGIFPGDYSEASITAFGVEMGKKFAKWEFEDALRKAEDAERKKAERKPRKPPRPSISTMIEQAEKATGKPVTSVTMPDGTKFDFNKAESTEPENEWPPDEFRTKEPKR
jgi:hypothetical protein